ncbi:MAG: transposase [Candidatus Marinimicrobia bacterium]|nr:transposase [Candidatus Neomarinimicrobiota bacterium]
MTHTHTRIWIHIIWGTKNHRKCLFKETGKKLYRHLMNLGNEIGVPLERLNIQPEHVHGLINLPSRLTAAVGQADKFLADVLQEFKGESSHWINDSHLMNGKFSWSRLVGRYGGFSVSISQLEKVKRYIENQSEHHRIKTFQEEYDEWKKRYGIFDD